MKQTAKALCALALAGALLAGCAAAGGASGSGGAAAADPLTGQELQYPGARAVGVTVQNAPDTAEQWGISEAEVVLEALAQEGSSTELCLVYPAVEAVPQVGPVAPGQDLYWRVLAGQQVLPVQRGGGTYDTNYLDYYNITAVDALVVGRNAFACEEGWQNAPAWHTSGTAIGRVLESLGVSASLSASGKTVQRTVDEATGEEQLFAPALLPFDGSARLPEASAEDAVGVRIRFGAQSATGFAYDAQSGTYRMQHADGTAQIDANNGTQAAFENVLVLYSAASLRDDGQTLDYDLTVGGGAWLHEGRLWNITWRQGSGSTFALYDEDGEALSLAPGRSYVALVSIVNGDELTVTDSAGSTVL